MTEKIDPKTPAKSSHPSILFDPGRVVATPGALAAMEENNILSLDLLSRHITGDCGVVPREDAEVNRDVFKYGSRILSSYTLTNGTRVWLITEADRSSTTFLLPEEY